MLAIIKRESGEQYVSPVFAIKEKGWDTEVIAFDSKLANIKNIRMWEPDRSVFIVQGEDFQDKKADWKGLGWVVNNRKLFKRLRFGKSTSIDDFPDFKPYAKEIGLPEWFEIKTQKDLDHFLNELSYGFHDGMIEEYIEEENDILIKIDTTWSCHITVKFAGVTEADIVEKVGMILDSDIVKTAEGFCWEITDGYGGWTDGVDFEAPFDKPYIKCKKIFWQIEID